VLQSSEWSVYNLRFKFCHMNATGLQTLHALSQRLGKWRVLTQHLLPSRELYELDNSNDLCIAIDTGLQIQFAEAVLAEQSVHFTESCASV
jgi:hypothetical protein